MGTRRTIITAIAALPFSLVGLAKSAAAREPIVDLIDAYRHGLSEFSLRADPDFDTLLAREMWGRYFDDICYRTPPINTVNGALAAMGLIYEESANHIGSEAVLPLCRAVATFLEAATV